MTNLKEVLEKLEENDMHVHEIDCINNPHLADTPLAWLSRSTHYILKGDKTVHVGNGTTIERFVLAL